MEFAAEGEASDRCGIEDILEECAKVHRRAYVQLDDGLDFTDDVTDVVTENHEDFAVFAEHGRIPLARIKVASRGVLEKDSTVQPP